MKFRWKVATVIGALALVAVPAVAQADTTPVPPFLYQASTGGYCVAAPIRTPAVHTSGAQAEIAPKSPKICYAFEQLYVAGGGIVATRGTSCCNTNFTVPSGTDGFSGLKQAGTNNCVTLNATNHDVDMITCRSPLLISQQFSYDGFGGWQSRYNSQWFRSIGTNDPIDYSTTFGDEPSTWNWAPQ